VTVKIKKDTLKEFLRKSLFEMDHVQYGMFDRPAPHDEKESKVDTTVPDDTPIQPAEMMASQLVDERPPVEDDNYTPENTEEFSRAVKALAMQVGSDNVKGVYKDFKRMVLDPREDKKEEDMDKETNESLRRAIRLVLKEANWDDDDDFRYRKDDGPDYSAMDSEPVNNDPDGAGLDQIASEFGYAGASGARQDIERMLQRMRYISEKMGKGDMDSLQDFAAQEFIDLMRAGEYIDDEDVVDLQQNVGMVKSLESFRFFFVSGIMMPAYNEIKRTARKKVEAMISDLGLPKAMNQSLLNQALGEVPKNLDKLEKKLLKTAIDSGVDDSDELDKMVDAMRKQFPALQKASELDGGLLDLAKERWGRQSKGRREKALAQALQSTIDWQEMDQ